MSAVTPAPINAPWLANWQRYPVQFFPFVVDGPVCRVTVPDDQWYRPIWANTVFTTSSTSANRSIVFGLSAPGAVSTLNIASTAVYAASLTVIGSAFVNASAYEANIDSTQHAFTVQYPDMIWPPGTIFSWLIGNNQVGDAFSAGESWLAAEMYAEQPDTSGQAVLTPTPVLT